jgi:hypothetical protein
MGSILQKKDRIPSTKEGLVLDTAFVNGCRGRPGHGRSRSRPREERRPALVTVHSETLTLTSGVLKNFAHPFYPDSDGSFGETYSDVGGATVHLHYHGRVIGEVMDADFTDYATDPPCEYHRHLRKK